MDDTEDENPFLLTILTSIKSTLLAPIQLLLSRPLLRAYLRTLLLLSTSLVFLALSTLAYATFYYAYIPTRGLSLPIHLQFDPSSSTFPYGVARIGSQGSLASRQRYDVVVSVSLPRTAGNLGVGNWMVEVVLRGPAEKGKVGGVVGGREGYDEWELNELSAVERAERVAEGTRGEEVAVLARSRRPAILTYRSAVVELAYRVSRLPWYLLGWRNEAETVEVVMLEGVEFDRGWRNVPATVRVELRCREVLQVYGVEVRFLARFEGLRYLMYNYRILSALFFITSFYAVSMTLLLTTWAAFSLIFSARSPDQPTKTESPTAMKHEPEHTDDEAMSDTSRTFPTYGRQPPLHYSSPKEEKEEQKLDDIPKRPEGDADDEEDEDADFVLEEPGEGLYVDSGLGTSMESSAERERKNIRRRSGGLGRS